MIPNLCLFSLVLLQTIDALAYPPALRLKKLLQSEIDGTREDEMPILMPCCYDGLTARLVARAGFEATFMTGFGVSGEFTEAFGASVIRITQLFLNHILFSCKWLS